MVGDGLNDAPALAAAHASLSPVTAAHLAQASADALFLGERLQPVADALALARRAAPSCGRICGIAVVYNLVAVPLAIIGLVTPLIAAAAMSGSSVLVTLNALRARIGAMEPAAASPVRRKRRRAPPFAASIARGPGEKPVMNILVYLLPIALSLGLLGLGAFLWSLKSGQYEDLDGAAVRILDDDDVRRG